MSVCLSGEQDGHQDGPVSPAAQLSGQSPGWGATGQRAAACDASHTVA